MLHPCHVRITGPLASHALELWGILLQRGYAPLSCREPVRLLAHLSAWMEQTGLESGQLRSEDVQRFIRHRRRRGRSLRGLRLVMEQLRRKRLIAGDEATADAKSPVGQLLIGYEDYLRKERAAASDTVRAYLGVARRFLFDEYGSGAVELECLAAARVVRFVLRASRKHSVATAKCVVTALRALLRFLYVRGDLSANLAGAVPAVAGWRLSPLPRFLEPGQVRLLMCACDRRTRVGQRDFAILLLLVRLGLRAGEVSALTLDDVDWTQGQLLVRGKGGHNSRLPLPVDVGKALAACLRRGRPAPSSRHLLLRMRAPYRALGSSAVSQIVRRACQRAGLAAVGAHRLRHTAATQMLRRGASLSEIAQVLRHRNAGTTALYAKVDRNSLRSLAMPWPGAGR
jgi:integrase/recombinase XerD